MGNLETTIRNWAIESLNAKLGTENLGTEEIVARIHDLEAVYGKEGQATTSRNLEVDTKLQILKMLDPGARIVATSERFDKMYVGKAYIWKSGTTPIPGILGLGADAYGEKRIDISSANPGTSLNQSQREASAAALAKGGALADALRSLGIGLWLPVYGPENRGFDREIARQDLEVAEMIANNKGVRGEEKPLAPGKIVKIAGPGADPAPTPQEDAQAPEAQSESQPESNPEQVPAQQQAPKQQRKSRVNEQSAASIGIPALAAEPTKEPEAQATPVEGTDQFPMTADEVKNTVISAAAMAGKTIGEIIDTNLNAIKWYIENRDKSSLGLSDKEKQALSLVIPMHLI